MSWSSCLGTVLIQWRIPMYLVGDGTVPNRRLLSAPGKGHFYGLGRKAVRGELSRGLLTWLFSSVPGLSPPPHSLSSPPPFGPQLGRSVLTSFWTMGLFSLPFPPICSVWLSLVVTLEGTTDCQTLFQLRRQGCFWLEPTFESGGWGDKPIAFLG